MASSLKSKLNALSASVPAAPRPAVPPALMEYVSRREADPSLFSLSPDGLRRMDFEGAFDPEGALFLDTETTGLSGGAGTVAFLVGLGRIERGGFAVYQFLMPHYGAEPQLLEKVASFIRGAQTLVTFNGRSFDVPLLRSRFVMCRMEDPTQGLRHLDLIYPARRAWKLRLKDCSLSHIEEAVLGVRRERDLPGAEVPERYFEFLKTGDMRLLEDIVEHNRQDIASLGTLLARLSRAFAAPAEQTSMLDVFSLGRALERRGEHAEAGACYRLAARERPISTMARLRERHVAGSANQRLSLMLRADRDFAEAAGVWREMIERGQMGVFPYVELAKLYEHRAGDPQEALRLTEAALALAGEEERAALGRRRARLLARVAAREKRAARKD